MDDDAFEPEPESEEATSSNSKQSHLSAEALAGLASTEDFSSVQLRKGGGGEAVGVDLSLLPYRKDIMLLQVIPVYNYTFLIGPVRIYEKRNDHQKFPNTCRNIIFCDNYHIKCFTDMFLCFFFTF